MVGSIVFLALVVILIVVFTLWLRSTGEDKPYDNEVTYEGEPVTYDGEPVTTKKE